MHLTIDEYKKAIASGTMQAKDVAAHYLAKAKKENPRYNAYLHFADQYIADNIDTLSQRPLLAGACI